MLKETTSDSRANIFFSCREEKFYSQETLIHKNTLTRIVAGEMRVVQAERTYIFRAGDTILFPRNQLARVTKYPVDAHPFTAVSIYLTPDLLRTYYAAHHLPQVHGQSGVRELKMFDGHPLLDSLFGSLLPYFSLSDAFPADIAAVKVEEAVSIVRFIDTGIDRILGHFDDPGKIDLVGFMEKNYMFNITAERFGYLTGRSLATFKRDFKKAFDTTPQRWLTRKRLELAHHLLVEKKRKPAEVYLEAGFENLSHFSFAFKKQFGYNPTSLIADPLNKASLAF